MKLRKMSGNSKVLLLISATLMILLSHCTYTRSKVDCYGRLEDFIPALFDDKQAVISRKDMELPKLKTSKTTNEDYFNFGVKKFDNRTKSYKIDGVLISLFDNAETGVYFLALQMVDKSTPLVVKFKSSIVKEIKFIGKGEDGDFYFIVEQETSCNKVRVTPPYYRITFSEY